jgi:hypothetical protein
MRQKSPWSLAIHMLAVSVLAGTAISATPGAPLNVNRATGFRPVPPSVAPTPRAAERTALPRMGAAPRAAMAPHGADFGSRIAAAVGSCTASVLGVTMRSFSAASSGKNGWFMGTAADGHELRVDHDASTYTMVELNVMAYGSPDPPAGHADMMGMVRQGMLATKFWGPVGYSYKRFQLSTSYSARDTGPAGILTTQVHELGHSLAQRLGRAPVNTEDPFAGRMQDCFNQTLMANR